MTSLRPRNEKRMPVAFGSLVEREIPPPLATDSRMLKGACFLQLLFRMPSAREIVCADGSRVAVTVLMLITQACPSFMAIRR